jgi:hypothetical protein
MLFKFSLLAGLASVAFAAQAETQAALDLQAMAASFDKIFAGIDSIVVKVTDFKDASAMSGIVSDFALIDSALTDGAAGIKKSKSMAIPELLNIFGPVFVMQSKVTEVISVLSSRKAMLEGAGAKETILSELQKTKQAADGLVDAIKANLPLPSITGIVAGPIAATITDVLTKGIKEWGGEPLAKAGTTPPKQAAPPKQSSAPAASAAPAGGRPARGFPKSPAKGSASAAKGSAPPAAETGSAMAPGMDMGHGGHGMKWRA